MVSLQAGELRKHSGRGYNISFTMLNKSNNIKNSSDIKNSSEDKEELHQPQQQLTNKRKTIRERRVYTTGIEGRRVTSSVLIKKQRRTCPPVIITHIDIHHGQQVSDVLSIHVFVLVHKSRTLSHKCRYTLSLRMVLPPQLLSLSTSKVYVHAQYA